MFAQNYAQLLAARAMVGLGEAGYGSVGAAMVATLFPQRMRAGLLGGFFACASIGSVLGVVLGGVIAARWGWQAAFGFVGVPGLVVALLYLFVRDYKTVNVGGRNPASFEAGLVGRGALFKSIFRSWTARWVCIGGAAQLIALSALWAWLPSFLNRTYGIAPDKAGIQAALVVLAGAVGGVVLGAIVDWAGARRPNGRFVAIACFCVLTTMTLVVAFGGKQFGITLSQQGQFLLILLGGFLATCTVGPAAAIVIDVIHPGVRSTGASILALFQNLFGLAAGPFIAGALSDAVGLDMALTLTPFACIAAAASFVVAGAGYEAERQHAGAEPVAPGPPDFDPAVARPAAG
jgi:MFS family permease